MHIGLIGGIGPAATEFYYRRLVRAFAAAGRKLEPRSAIWRAT
jgi:aspartate racemase